MRAVVVTLCMLCCVAGGCATTSLPPVSSGAVVWEEDEKRLWLRAEEEQEVWENSGLLCEDPVLEGYLHEVAQRLQPPEMTDQIPFRIYVIKNNLFNAFAYPNGVIYIHTGILARIENEAQLATLLAHEMTHCTHRHLVRQFRDLKNKTAFITALSVTVGSVGYVGQMAALLGTLGTIGAVTGYSQELETEADMEGLRRVVAAGYDPHEAPKLFLYLKKDLEEDKRKEPFLFGSHPKLAQRIANYEEALQTEYGTQQGGIVNDKIFLEKVCRVLVDNAELDIRAGRYKGAERALQKYLAAHPECPRGNYLAGEVCRERGETGDVQKAAEWYRQAIAADPGYPEAHKYLGLVLYKQGEKESAGKEFRQYLKLAPSASDRAYVEQYLNECGKEGLP